MLTSSTATPASHPALTRLLVDRWARVVTAAAVAVTAPLVVVLTAALPHGSWPVLQVIWCAIALLAMLGLVASRPIGGWLLRDSPARWLAERAHRVEAWSSAAALVLYGGSLLLATAALVLLTAVVPIGVFWPAFLLALVAIIGAWIQPALMAYAVALGHRGAADRATWTRTEAVVLGGGVLVSVAVLAAITVTAGAAGLCGAAICASAHYATLRVGKARLARRLDGERHLIASSR